jgi:type II secretory pathway component PulK
VRSGPANCRACPWKARPYRASCSAASRTQGRFNVNNLIDADGEIDELALEQFQRLLQVLEIDPRFAGIAADWIDANQEAGFPDGAEDAIYTGLIPAYRTPNVTLTNVSELAALEGMDKATFDVLLPHIVALPGGTGINANTATAAVLQSLDENLTTTDVEGLMSEREDGGFADLSLTSRLFSVVRGVTSSRYCAVLELPENGGIPGHTARHRRRCAGKLDRRRWQWCAA